MEKELTQEQQLLEFRPPKAFTIISKGRVVSIAFDEVTHVRKFGYETIIYTNEREYRAKYSIQDILNELPVNDFFRIHKSHIVALKHVVAINKGKIRMQETWLQVSGYYKRQMCESLAKMLNRGYDYFMQA